MADALASGASLSNQVQVQPLSRAPFNTYMTTNQIIDFYKQTSPYTNLGLYTEFARNLPDDLGELCRLQRAQIIHPFHLVDETSDKAHDPYFGDLTSVSDTSLPFENDLFPTAQSIIAELLRRDPRYGLERKNEDKLHLCCREQAILLASVLKAKGFAARVRSGFQSYSPEDETFYDHWITEYYRGDLERWVLVDADFSFEPEILQAQKINLNFLDLPRNQFLFAAQAYLGIRKGILRPENISYSSVPPAFGLSAAIRVLFYDFHSLMNDEVIFSLAPKYVLDQDFQLSENEYTELDQLAELMLNPEQNFDALRAVWESQKKFRIMSGGLNAE